MPIDVTAQVDTSALADGQTADASDVKNPIDDLVGVINNALNGSQEFEVLRGVLVSDPAAHATHWKLYFKSTGLFVRQSTADGGAVVGPLGVAGAGDAAAVTYTPADATDYDVTPAFVKPALDEIADRLTTVEGGGGGGGAPDNATYITQTPSAGLSAEQPLSALATGILKNTTTTGVLSIATGADLPSHVHDSADVTYTPTTLADWDGAADPGDVDQALDQLAERVTDVESGGGGGATPGVVEGRLTLSSSLPVTVSDITAATTLYFLPHNGNRVTLYNGSTWAEHTIADAGVSIAIPATTDTNYDAYLYDNTGTLTLDLTAWTNDTTRATALVKQNGVWVKTGATSRRYIGTIRTTGVSGQCEDSVAKRHVWNLYNRILRRMLVQESANSWTYTTASWRPYNNSTANRIAFVSGLQEDSIEIMAVGINITSSGTPYTGIGIDSTSTNSAEGTGNGQLSQPFAQRSHVSGQYLGFHYAQQLEYGSAGATFYGDNNIPDRLQACIRGAIWG